MGRHARRPGLIGGTRWEWTLEAELLGTLDDTMQGDYCKDRLRRSWGIETVVPTPDVQARVHAIAVDEVARGCRSAGSRAELVGIIRDMCAGGAEGVIEGCAKLPPLVAPGDVGLPVFDSMGLHVDAVIERALG